MNIIDRKTGKRISNENKEINKKLKEEDPIKKHVVKDAEMEEYSPMDPPDAYDATKVGDVGYDDMHP